MYQIGTQWRVGGLGLGVQVLGGDSDPKPEQLCYVLTGNHMLYRKLRLSTIR